VAKVTIQLPDDFQMAVSRLADRTDDIVPKALEAGGKVVLARVRGNLQASIGRGLKYKGRSTGQLLGSLGLSKARLARDGQTWDVKVGFAEPRRGGDKVSNAMLANLLEYGKSGQPPKPFLKPAKSQSKAECVAAMKAKLEEEIERI
jgi:HK97 gp10 family phage protein